MRARASLVIALVLVGIAGIVIAGREYIWVERMSPPRVLKSASDLRIPDLVPSTNAPVVFASGPAAHDLAGLCPGQLSGELWQPRLEDIRAAEHALKALLTSGALPLGVSDPIKYVRQYVGVHVGDRQIICLSASTVSLVKSISELCAKGLLSDDAACNSDWWRKKAIRVHDGGLGFWRVLFDPVSGEFTDFESNGVA